MKHFRKLQMHLSTAILLMFVIGGLLQKNIRERKQFEAKDEVYSSEFLHPISQTNETMVFCRAYGWPYMAVIFHLHFRPEVRRWDDTPWEWDISRVGITIDFAIGVIILFGTWFLSELWIRWRARRNLNRPPTKSNEHMRMI